MSTTQNTVEVPAGYMMNAKGNLVKKSNIKKIDLDREALVQKLWKRGKKLSQEAVQFKSESLDAIDALVEKTATEHGVVLGGKKGNVTITSFDGSIRIIRAISDRVAFTEQLQVAKTLIHEMLEELTKGARKEIKALIDNAFQIDKQGDISVPRILGLRRVNIQHAKWKRAMEVIADSIRIESSKEYIRFYERNNAGEYTRVNFDTTG